ncbi:pilus assembly protein PilW [Ectothiorhodospira sp. BSL-9]|nr:pilus assembly protein PilW [Ectothiorhodospira sp. BSL-9]
MMVAITLSLILTAGMIHIFTGSSQTYRLNEAASRVQENGRFAIDQLTWDLRQAGFRGGCRQQVNNLLDLEPNDADYLLFDLENAINGWNNTAGPAPADYQAGTDVLLIKHAARISGVTASGNTPAHANTINLTQSSTVPQGAIVFVTNASNCDIFQNRANLNASTLTRGAAGNPGNKNPGQNHFSDSYQDDMEIFLLRSHLYYIGTGSTGAPALMRVSHHEGLDQVQTEELVEGVRDMQITYGVDTNGNREINVFQTANQVTNWQRVLAIRVSLLLQSNRDFMVDAPMTVAFNGNNVTPGDRRFYQVFTTTVGIRNRLP